MSDDETAYHPTAGFVPMPVQAAINAYVGVARNKRDKASGISIPEHAPLGNISVLESKAAGLTMKRKNKDEQVFSQTLISKRHRPIHDVVEVEAEAAPTGGKPAEFRRFCGITRDILPAGSAFISLAKRGLIPVRRPYTETDDTDFVAGRPVFFDASTKSAGKSKLGTLTHNPSTRELVGTAVACIPGQDFYVHLHPVSARGMRAFANAIRSKDMGFSAALRGANPVGVGGATVAGSAYHYSIFGGAKAP